MSDPVDAYDAKAADLATRYESWPAEEVHSGFVKVLADGNGRMALDVGAGSGRDAAWLASKGFGVVAVEPSASMRREAQARHPEANIRWIDDRLPELARVLELAIAFDRILLSAVWMHVPPDLRARAFERLVALLKPGGILLMTLRNGPDDQGRIMWSTSVEEIAQLAIRHGIDRFESRPSDDRFSRPGVSWTNVCLRRPDAVP